MPRRKRLRKIVAPPGFKGYRPFGTAGRKNGFIELHYEEYEALKLADYDLMNHQEASELMNISRPTFARIYETARRKIAQAFVEAREIRSVYGNAWLDGNWSECMDCHAKFTIPANIDQTFCPVCKSKNIEKLHQNQQIKP